MVRDTCYFIANATPFLEVSILVGLIDDMVLCTIAFAETSFLFPNKRYIWSFLFQILIGRAPGHFYVLKGNKL